MPKKHVATPMFDIHPDIRYAATLPGTFYNSSEVFALCRERIFARSWQLVTDAENVVKLPHDAMPFQFMDGFMEEPLLLLRDGDTIRTTDSGVLMLNGVLRALLADRQSG